jgi:hypothetical protein
MKAPFQECFINRLAEITDNAIDKLRGHGLASLRQGLSESSGRYR